MNQSASMPESIKRSEPIKSSKAIKRPGIDLNEDPIDHYEPEKINGVFDDKHIEYQSSGSKNTPVQ